MCHPVPTGHPECWLASCGWSKPYTRHWDLTIMLWMANLTSRTWSNHTTTTHICPWSSATANLLATHYKGGQPTAQQNMTVCCLGSKMEEQALHWQNLRNTSPHSFTPPHTSQVAIYNHVLKVNFWGKWKFSLYWHVWFQWIICSEKHAVWQRAAPHGTSTITWRSTSSKSMSLWWTTVVYLSVCTFTKENEQLN